MMVMMMMIMIMIMMMIMMIMMMMIMMMIMGSSGHGNGRSMIHGCLPPKTVHSHMYALTGTMKVYSPDLMQRKTLTTSETWPRAQTHVQVPPGDPLQVSVCVCVFVMHCVHDMCNRHTCVCVYVYSRTHTHTHEHTHIYLLYIHRNAYIYIYIYT
jgi:hypothetical protein